MTQTQKLIEVALAIVSNWDDGFPVHGDEQIADDFRTALDAAKQEHRAEPETALSYVRDMVLNDRGPLEGMGMTNDQTNAMLAIIDAAPVAAQPAPYERFPTEWLERKIAEGPDVDIGAAQPAPVQQAEPDDDVSPLKDRALYALQTLQTDKHLPPTVRENMFDCVREAIQAAQPAPEVPVDESIADLARYIQILCRESKNDC